MGLWTITSQNVIAQIADPGAVGAGVLWTDTNADLTYRRNDANDDWILIQAGVSTVSTTEMGYLDGVTSAIQTQLDAKLSSITTQEDTITSNFTTTSTTMVDITGLAITVPTRTNGIGIAILDALLRSDTLTATAYTRIVYGATNGIEGYMRAGVTDTEVGVSRTLKGVLDGTVVKAQLRASSGTAMAVGYAGGGTILNTLEIS